VARKRLMATAQRCCVLPRTGCCACGRSIGALARRGTVRRQVSFLDIKYHKRSGAAGGVALKIRRHPTNPCSTLEIRDLTSQSLLLWLPLLWSQTADCS
jgi:hypothetical protein